MVGRLPLPYNLTQNCVVANLLIQKLKKLNNVEKLNKLLTCKNALNFGQSSIMLLRVDSILLMERDWMEKT